MSRLRILGGDVQFFDPGFRLSEAACPRVLAAESIQTRASHHTPSLFDLFRKHSLDASNAKRIGKERKKAPKKASRERRARRDTSKEAEATS